MKVDDRKRSVLTIVLILFSACNIIKYYLPILLWTKYLIIYNITIRWMPPLYKHLKEQTHNTPTDTRGIPRLMAIPTSWPHHYNANTDTRHQDHPNTYTRQYDRDFPKLPTRHQPDTHADRHQHEDIRPLQPARDYKPSSRTTHDLHELQKTQQLHAARTDTTYTTG